MDKLKVAIIGMGCIAQDHMRVYEKRDDVEVVACADLDFEKSKEQAAKHGIPRAYQNIYDLIKSEEKIDYIDICTWTASHAECVIAAAEAGIDVMCEKPTCDTLENAAKMRDAVKKNNVRFMLAVPLRYGNKTKYIRKLVDDGALGEVYYAKTFYTRGKGIPGGWFSDLKYSGGGPVLDIGVHRIDLAWYLMGNPKPVSVSAATSYRIGDYRNDGTPLPWEWPGTKVPDYEFGTEDMAHGFIKFENGAALYFATSWAFHSPQESATFISGSKAGVDCDNGVIYHYANGKKIEGELGDVCSMSNEIAHFIDCIRNDETPISDIDQAYQLMQMLNGVYRSAESGKEFIIE